MIVLLFLVYPSLVAKAQHLTVENRTKQLLSWIKIGTQSICISIMMVEWYGFRTLNFKFSVLGPYVNPGPLASRMLLCEGATMGLSRHAHEVEWDVRVVHLEKNLAQVHAKEC